MRARPTDVVNAHHDPAGGFRNPWPDSRVPGPRALVRMIRERRRAERDAPTPPRGSFPTAMPAIANPRGGAGEYSATWIGHSTVYLQMGGLNVITDPVFSERAFPVQWVGPRRVMVPALPLDALPPIDVVLLSHSHYDHFDKPATKWLARHHPGATWVVPLGLRPYVTGFGVRSAIEVDWWESIDVRGMRVTATPARHFSARRLGDRNTTLWCGYALSHGERRAYFAGDTAYHPEFSAIGQHAGPFDLVMMPIGAYDPRWFMHVVHVDPEEALQGFVDVLAGSPAARTPLMLGIHWGTFRLTSEPMDEPPKRTTARWKALTLDPDRLWIAAFGETRSW
jgi:N-acyl-phosphatidylethanolamine-hydrolysing phospholipase D